jgi:transposase
MDKAQDREAMPPVLHEQGEEAVIRRKTNRLEEIPSDQAQYQGRQKVERFSNKLKYFKHILTRYDKLSRTFLAFIHLVATWMILRSFVNTTW